ncbi:Rhodanese-related sulfurtransferase [Geoalkalibacter ferrihydriticus]|uniref:Rhodanese domain-containing protein n=2 Tax=Geoalkalibacter ferrihydriticus TaxID=392333 RepID=A0A0C2EBY8_9BACT|nr:rhodanese-like domain-containing protein [Geoalkalibacter ferrihydriticus]KIH76083.1 hypothetical protein GFER_12600 [Geoalkalibacter ferrihydriticus DSM 17813]SDM46286.1 Rhodanese-related sulfurtransferase [Geoalkalibacter ferrihydriticus]
MGFFDFFRPIPNMSIDEVRRFLLEHNPEEFYLIDVRQPREYEQGHLPGALLIPIHELRERLAELDAAKTAITYCTAGPRSRAAAATLIQGGFHRAYNMDGGIRAWQGAVVEGDPAAQRVRFSSEQTPVQHLALAWMLEEGSRAFYAAAAEMIDELEAAHFMRRMAAVEADHKAALAAAFLELTGNMPEEDFPRSVVGEAADEVYVEGGLLLSEVLIWLQDKSPEAIVEFAMGMEANAYDHYLLLRVDLKEEKSRELFSRLAEEEQSHLRALTERLERLISSR